MSYDQRCACPETGPRARKPHVETDETYEKGNDTPVYVEVQVVCARCQCVIEPWRVVDAASLSELLSDR